MVNAVGVALLAENHQCPKCVQVGTDLHEIQKMHDQQSAELHAKLANLRETNRELSRKCDALQTKDAEQSALINACADDLLAAKQMLERHGATPYFLQDRLADIAARTQH